MFFRPTSPTTFQLNLDIFSARLSKNFYQDYEIKKKVNLQALFFCSSTQTMPQDNEDKNENVTFTPSPWIVFTIDDGGEKYRKQTPFQLAHIRT